jgi:ribonuclease R
MAQRTPKPARATHGRIIEILKSERKPVTLGRLASLASLNENDPSFRDAVLQLRHDGIIYAEHGFRYAVSAGKRAKRGRISVNERGFGFVIPDEGGEDVYVPEGRIADAIDGDMVLVTSTASRSRPGSRSGNVLGVVSRPERPIVGTLRRKVKKPVIHPDSSSLPDLILQGALPEDAANDVKIVARMQDVTLTGSLPKAMFEQILGTPGDPEAAIQGILHQYELIEDYPPAALREAEGISADIGQVEDANVESNRRDIRSWEIITIDPADAADLDDAVSLTHDEQGRRVVGIHIADVSHYVNMDGEIDREAVSRGTSVYLPDRVIHMLPKALSAGVCSLLPDVDRLAVSVLVTLDDHAQPVDTEVFRSVIRSRAKLSYESVEEIIKQVGTDDNPASVFTPLIRDLAEIAEQFTASRLRAGALDFNVPEVKVTVGSDGRVESVQAGERLASHRLIEECMLLANRSVAKLLNDREYGILFRVHAGPDPEKLREVVSLAAALGHTIPSGDTQPSSNDLQALLNAVKGEPIAPVIQTHLIRSMAKAIYQPDNIGHFGLAAETYAHFTSPIRRYPDLVVHRQVKRMLDGEATAYKPEHLESLGRSTSEAEQNAERAERDAIKIKQAEYLRDHLGDQFEGAISGVTRGGVFVMLTQSLVEGRISTHDLPKDDYVFDVRHMTLIGRRRRQRYRFGDPVTVQVARVDTDQGRIDFTLVEAPNAATNKSDPPVESVDKREKQKTRGTPRRGRSGSSKRGATTASGASTASGGKHVSGGNPIGGSPAKKRKRRKRRR